MHYIGLSCGFHDASMSVIDDSGNILFAGHSERYTKRKHDKDLSLALIQDGLSHVKGDYQIHYYEKPLLKYLRQLRAGQRPSIMSMFMSDMIEPNIRQSLGYRSIKTHGHHLSHAAAGFQTSPFDEATVVIIDAMGEFDTISIYDAHYDDKGIARYNRLWSKKYPDSIGLFYSAMTKRLGLQPLDEEYIMMGMAGYGEPKHYAKMHCDFIKDGMEIDFAQNLHTGIDDDYLAGADDMDIASSGQELLEQLVMNVMQRARMIGKSRNLVYGGGVALNCLANRHLGEYFEKIWIMPNPGDAGSSLGACALGHGRSLRWDSPYLGYDIKGKYPVNRLLGHLRRGDVVGVANGRSEFGPRALGNRSLLADPRGSDIKDRVNEIKRRQKFRPFAPAILSEMADHYFDMPRGWVDSPYMQSVAKCKYPNDYPAICHVDGTSRVQTVSKDCRSGLRQLLEKWYILTGCPMLLNTSLNIRGEPMVNDHFDAKRFQNLYNIKVL